MKNLLLLPMAFAALSACGGGATGGGDVVAFSTTSQNYSPSQLNELPENCATTCNYAVRDIQNDGYLVSVGYDTANLTGQRRLVAETFLLRGTNSNLGTDLAQGPGSLTYIGNYQISDYANLDAAVASGGATITRNVGSISLAVDLNTFSITGTSNDGNLNIVGTVSADGGGLNGTSVFNGTVGTLDGVIGTDKVIGLVAGNTTTTAYAGGIIATIP